MEASKYQRTETTAEEEQTENDERNAESLQNLAANFLAKKLMRDIRSELDSAETESKKESYKEYIQSNPLTPEAQRLVLKELVKNEPSLSWEILPCDVIHKNLGINNLRNIIVLNNDQLLVHYDERTDSKLISRIKILNIKTNICSYINADFGQIYIQTCSISKDLKTLFLWSYDNSLIIVYDLVNKREISRINPGKHITDFCLLNNDTLICCGFEKGIIKIFDIISAEEALSIDVNSRHEINIIDSSDNMIAVHIGWQFKSFQFITDKEIQCVPIASFQFKCFEITVENMTISASGKKMLAYYQNKEKKIVEFFDFPKFRSLKRYEFFPGHDIYSFKLNKDRRIILTRKIDHKNMSKLKRMFILDGESGEIIRKFNLAKKEFLAIDGSELNRFAIAPNNDYIVLFNHAGQIAKINLNLDQDLENTLNTIKLALEKRSIKNAQLPDDSPVNQSIDNTEQSMDFYYDRLEEDVKRLNDSCIQS